jgi:hypothetical protein
VDHGFSLTGGVESVFESVSAAAEKLLYILFLINLHCTLLTYHQVSSEKCFRDYFGPPG